MSRYGKVNHGCKVCRDAGKCKEEWMSHDTTNGSGLVICLTLLNQECRYCGDLGHTPKYCVKAAKDKADRERDAAKFKAFQERQQRIKSFNSKSSVKSKEQPKAQTGRFAMLCDDSDDESPRKAPSPKKKQSKTKVTVSDDESEFPALPSNTNIAMWPEHAPETLRGKPMAWNDMITMARGVMDGYVTPELSGLFDLKRDAKGLSERETKAAIHRQECFKGLNGKGWADLDSDDDDW
jgi:hypothetical protein